MNWLNNYVRPKIKALVGRADVPDNLWHKCPSCGHMSYHKELTASLWVCPHCNHHMRISARKRLELLFDKGAYETLPLPSVNQDPLRFRDSRRYAERLRSAQNETGEGEAVIIAKGAICGVKAIVLAFNFEFMGGSMGMAVGEGLVAAADAAVKNALPLITIPASGGARMQEGILSLMQMPRTVIAIQQVKEAGLPYLVLLTDPTTGGVSASFAMLGDIQIAEPGAVIGFAGRRVIEGTVRESLPDDFQRAEYLMDHGMVDLVVRRKDLPETLGRVLRLLTESRPPGVPAPVADEDSAKPEVAAPVDIPPTPTPAAE